MKVKQCDRPSRSLPLQKRVYNCFIHLDIKDNKIWIQRNMTEADLAQDLMAMGVVKEDIVLGLHPPYKRPLTGYAVA